MDSAIGTFEDADRETKLRQENDAATNGHEADGMAQLDAKPRGNNREIDCGDGEGDSPPEVTAPGSPPNGVHAP